MFDLGQRVAFEKYYVKSGETVNFDHLTEEQEKELDEKDYITLSRLKEVHHKRKLEGIVCGKRRIAETTTLMAGYSDYGNEGYLYVHSHEMLEVYLVATSFGRQYKVHISQMEVV